MRVFSFMKGFLPEAAITQARLPTELPTSTVGFWITFSKKSNINCIYDSEVSTKISKWIGQQPTFGLGIVWAYLSPCLHGVRKTCRLVRSTKAKKINGINSVTLWQYTNIPEITSRVDNEIISQWQNSMYHSPERSRVTWKLCIQRSGSRGNHITENQLQKKSKGKRKRCCSKKFLKQWRNYFRRRSTLLNWKRVFGY